jgi:GntP family gluconate:H+ symporter
MSSFDIQLLLIALASVLVLVALIVSRIRLHPLLALLVVSMGVGFATGMAPGEIVKNLTNGAGKTLGAVGVVIALGAMLARSSRTPAPPSGWPAPSCSAPPSA